jgi:hypothetical protein
MNATQKKPTEAWIDRQLFNMGLGHVVIARYKGSGEVEAGFFLVDVFCLGVKNAFFQKTGQAQFDDALKRFFRGSEQSVSPAYARKLVEASVAYAGNLGLAPHADYKKASKVFGGIVASDCHEEFSFGRDGKPFYMEGPDDSPARVNQIMRLLTAKCGEGNFDFMLEASDEGLEFDPELPDGHTHGDCDCGHDHEHKDREQTLP